MQLKPIPGWVVAVYASTSPIPHSLTQLETSTRFNGIQQAFPQHLLAAVRWKLQRIEARRRRR